MTSFPALLIEDVGVPVSILYYFSCSEAELCLKTFLCDLKEKNKRLL